MQNLNPSRNPKLKINNRVVQTVGDVHLGRSYTNGVPLHMRGGMENLQREAFERLLAIDDVDYLVFMGDIFDSFIVAPTVVDYAASRILDYARSHPKVHVVVLRGNHDESKDTTIKSSFDNLVLALREAKLPNLKVVTHISIMDSMAFISWSAKQSAKELAEQLDHKYEAVFGHWDINLPKEANHYNAIPLEQLKGKTKLVVTGHVHYPQVFGHHDMQVVVTGSIIPLAHGEETEEDDLFYTLTVAEYEKDPDKYKHRVVRFALAEDEELPEGDFLQVKAYVKPTSIKSEPDAETDTFDPAAILYTFLVKEEVKEEKAKEVVGRFHDQQDRD